MDSKTPAPNTADKMKSVKAACDNATAGPKKDSAMKHFHAAEKAHTAKNDSDCNRELDAAKQALV
ncbi:hypothetical protein ACSSV8_003444 [Roseovarius sp. MBR-79]|jgi:hypothetical protein